MIAILRRGSQDQERAEGYHSQSHPVIPTQSSDDLPYLHLVEAPTSIPSERGGKINLTTVLVVIVVIPSVPTPVALPFPSAANTEICFADDVLVKTGRILPLSEQSDLRLQCVQLCRRRCLRAFQQPFVMKKLA